MLQDGIVEEARGVTLAELGLQSAFRDEARPDAVGVLSWGRAPMSTCRSSRLMQAIVSGMRMIFREIPIIIELAELPSVILRK
jgi:hypothetical protein